MKIAAISDIHGNLGALDAVLADAARRKVDRIVNLGDILSGGLYSRDTAERLMPVGLPTIRGNHERPVLTIPLDKMSKSDRHAALALQPDQIEWVGSLPETLRLSDDVTLVHGTPGSNLEYFLETVTEDGIREATPDEMAERAGDVGASVILCGHTHIPRVAKLDDGRLIVNPGSGSEVDSPGPGSCKELEGSARQSISQCRYPAPSSRATVWTGRASPASSLLSVTFARRRRRRNSGYHNWIGRQGQR